MNKETSIYTVREFRAKLSKALDEVRDGKKVVIVRNTELFTVSPAKLEFTEGQGK